MILKVVNAILILFAVYMGIKQGWAMLTGKPEMLDMFRKWNVNETGLLVYGGITLLSALLILYPKTFLWGNFLMAAAILLLISLHLQDRNLKGVGIEIPFFLLNLVIIYLQHPLAKIH
ncbi:hypothetical protein [Xanthocytophaga agilis]|uniref:DoxX family protein n=1 Tax=Xanthocytophaga agilis TaxID=3048010 RepID=A0AAE3UHH6_9BACT|nr:hypothetical protein [Xanthocytophaga agilis]MDJ1504346.1 hypothetical protein [Xanthocytophaga agilis]